MKPTHFAAPSEFRAWLEEHHATAAEVWVGFYKKGTGKPSMSWSEAVDEALCFGWIDSRQQGVDDESYVIRFTPRKPRSNWSLVNIRKVEELTREGRMRPAGLETFERRSGDRSGIYSYEQRKAAALGEAFERRFRDNAKAWEFFQAQAPSYRRTAVWWVVSAKQAETREKRLVTLIEDSEYGRTLKHLTRRPKPA
ncbi:MAG: YdeI/OmpD-associated family protein [Gaiellaceae bacterium]